MQLAGLIITPTVRTPSLHAADIKESIVTMYVLLATMAYTAPPSNVVCEWKRLPKIPITPDPVSQ